MDALRDGLLRVADDITFALRNAGQSFAFLSDGRDMVSIAEAETGFVVALSDHADEGWPGFEFPVPGGAHFHQATESILRRCAHFVVHDDLKSVREFARAVGLEGRLVGGEFRAKLKGGARLVAWETHYDRDRTEVRTMITVRQRREPDAIRAAMLRRDGARVGGV